MNFKLHLFFLGAGGTFWGSFLLSGAEPRWLPGVFIHFFSLFLLWFFFPKVLTLSRESQKGSFPENAEVSTKNVTASIFLTTALLLGAQLCFLKNLWSPGTFLFGAAVLFLTLLRAPVLSTTTPRKESFFEKLCFFSIFSRSNALAIHFSFLSVHRFADR